MIAEMLVDDTTQYVCHKKGKDIFQKMADTVSSDFKRHSIDVSADQIMEAFRRQKTGTLSFMVGEHTIKWHFTDEPRCLSRPTCLSNLCAAARNLSHETRN